MALLNKNILHRIFRISIFLKAIDSLLEIIGGILLFLLKPVLINNFVKALARNPTLLRGG